MEEVAIPKASDVLYAISKGLKAPVGAVLDLAFETDWRAAHAVISGYGREWVFLPPLLLGFSPVQRGAGPWFTGSSWAVCAKDWRQFSRHKESASLYFLKLK